MLLGRSVAAYVSFRLAEDIHAKAPHHTILGKKGTEESFPVARPRTLRSYCHEFVGKEDLRMEAVRFSVGGRPAELDSEVRTGLSVLVHNAEEELPGLSGNALKDALYAIKSGGNYADVRLVLAPGLEIPAHKFILMTRSDYFRSLFTSFPELDRYEVPRLPNLGSVGFPDTFRQVLNWIYTAEVFLSVDYLEVVDIALLAHEYRLDDLKVKCEDHLLVISNEHNLLGILLTTNLHQHIFSADFLEMTIHCFVESYDKIILLFDDVEEKICGQKGLVSKILSFVNSRKNKLKRVSFLSKESSIHLD